VLRVPSVAYLLGSAQGPMPLADDEIRAVRKLTDDTLWAEPCPYISLGQRVKVRSGALKDLEGVLVRKKDAFRLVVSVDTIMRSVMIEVNAANIEIIPMRVAA
jgi:transcription antitermination factor NusG